MFCFGGLLFVSCVTVCGCGCGGLGGGDVKSWDGCCWGGGGRPMEVCVMGICGENRDV